jgi:hypothetical protein
LGSSYLATNPTVRIIKQSSISQRHYHTGEKMPM